MKIKLPLQTVISLFFITGIVTVLSSCLKKDDYDFDRLAEASWNPNVSLPLVHSSMSISKILQLTDSGSTIVDSSNFITIVYKGNIYSVAGYEFLQFSNQSFALPIALAAPEINTLADAGSVTTSGTINYQIQNRDSAHIDSMLLGQGTMAINISSQIRHGGSLHISMPTAMLNGIPFSVDIPFSYNNQLPIEVAANFDLAGYDFNLSSAGSYNTLPINFSIRFDYSGNPTQSTEAFTLTTSFNDMTIKTAYGDFGSRRISVDDDSSRIELFNNAISGILTFADPKVEFLISNSFGIPMYSYFSSLYSHSAVNGDLNISGSGIPVPIPVDMPTYVGETRNTSFYLDRNNSNIDVVMMDNPQYIGYSLVDSIIGGSSSHFVQDSSRLKVDVRVELPLYGYANGFVIQDTLDFQLADIEQLEWAKFRINITNGFPLDSKMQIYFADSSYNPLDSMISPPGQIVNAGLVHPVTGIVYHQTLKTTDEYFSKSRLQNIYNAQKLIIRAELNSFNTPTLVKIYSDYGLDVKLGLQAQLKLDLQ